MRHHYKMYGYLCLGIGLLWCVSNSYAGQVKNIKALCSTDTYLAKQQVIAFSNKAATAPQLFFLHNTSAIAVRVDNAMKRVGSANAGWTSSIDPRHWSAILLTPNSNFTLLCSQFKNNQLKQIDCGSFIKVCRVQKATYATQRDGSYWVTESQSNKQFLPALQKQGITF